MNEFIVINNRGEFLDHFNDQEEAEDAISIYKQIDLDESGSEGEYEIERICEVCEHRRPLSEKSCGHCENQKEQMMERLHSYRM